MRKKTSGGFVNMDGEVYYKISNYDCMDNFFMTLTSSSDIWNFCWSYGGITAGRVDKERALFPYYTADKVADGALYTGPYTAIAVDGACRSAIHGHHRLSSARCSGRKYATSGRRA